MTAKYDCVARVAVKVRPQNHTNNVSNETLLAGEKFQISAIVPDALDPNNSSKKWGHIYGGKYHNKFTALEYPGNIVPISTYTLIPATVPTEPTVPIPPFKLDVEWTGEELLVFVDGEEYAKKSS